MGKEEKETYKTEKALQEDIMNAVNRRKDARLFRNNVGQCKESNIGLKYGLRKGSSDLIGFTKIIVTPNMVGKPIAIFTAIELKVKNKKPTPKQITFIKTVRNFGGIACVARDVNDISRIFGEEIS